MIPVNIGLLRVIIMMGIMYVCSYNKIEMKYFSRNVWLTMLLWLGWLGWLTLWSCLSHLTTLRCHSPEVPGSGCGLSCPIWMKASWREGRQPWNKYCVTLVPWWIITLWENNMCLTSSTMGGGGWCWLARKCPDIFIFICTLYCTHCILLSELCLQSVSQIYLPPSNHPSSGDWDMFLWDIWNVCYGNDNPTLTINGFQIVDIISSQTYY